MIFDGFVGPSYTGQSLNVDAERTLNLYLEGAEAGNPKARVVLYGTPGIHLFATLPTQPLRGLWEGAGRLFAVAGSFLYEVFANGTYNSRGSVGSDGLPVQIFPNGQQLLIVSAGSVWIDTGTAIINPSTSYAGVCNVDATGKIVASVSGDTFDASFVGQLITIAGGGYLVASAANDSLSVTLAGTGPVGLNQAFTASIPVPASIGTFLDSYGIVTVPNSRQFKISRLNDFLKWDGLDFGVKEGYADHLVSVLADHEELWLFGDETTEVWANTGAALFPFERIPGAFIHMGCVAAYSPQRLAGGVAWLGADSRGQVIAYRAQGFLPQRISTHAMETAWSLYSTCADAWSFTYTERGHEFWVINFPTGDATWAFDATAGQWHERAHLVAGTLHRQLQCCHAFVFGKHLCGDRADGSIWQQSADFFDENGAGMQRIRTAPHISTEQMWQFFSQFQLDAEVGTSLAAPSCTLDWSDDGGHTWSTPVTTTPSLATYDGRLIWRRLGKSRDRVFRVTITGTSKIAIIRAILKLNAGAS